MKTEKTFDCVEMKHRGAEEVQKTLAGMTPEEELAYWQSGTEELRQRQKRLRAEAEGPELVGAQFIAPSCPRPLLRPFLWILSPGAERLCSFSRPALPGPVPPGDIAGAADAAPFLFAPHR